MAIPQQLQALVDQGYFDKVADGDGRASGLFTRLAAYALNPSGDPAGWGCLRKTGGGKNIEGYSEDAIVLGNDPNNLHNVRDIIGGAGAPGARLNWGDGFVNRRTSDIWEKPVALNAEQLAYLKPGGEVPGPTPPPTPTPQPTPACRYQPTDLGPVLAAVAHLQEIVIDASTAALRAEDAAKAAERRANEAALITENISERLADGLTIVEGRAGWAGAMSGKVKG